MTRPVPLSISVSSLTIAALLGATAACTPFRVETPSGYVKLKKTDHPYKAVSAEGAVLAVRHWDNEPEATMAFWDKVVDDELTKQRGYTPHKTRAVKTAAGLTGRWHRYVGAHRGEPHYYVLVLFVTDDHIFTVEATAPEKDFARHERAIRAFVRSFTPD